MKFSFRLISVIMAIIMTVCAVPVFALADAASSFTDFPSGSWSEEAMNAAVANGLIIGKGNNIIAPKDYITRAETAAIINRAFGATVKADISSYTDVSPSQWYYAEMQKAVNMQTLEGVSSTELNPEGYITRESVFAILARALVLSDTDESKLLSFTDGASVSPWARSYTAALVNRGYINGNGANYIKPQDYITREEFAQMMHNIFKVYIPEGSPDVSDAVYGTTIVRAPNLTLKNLVINGDLIVADGVGSGNINLDNVKVSGRILFRGGEGKVKLTKTTVGQFVIVHDINGVVNFNNYRTESVFTGIVLDTEATFLKRTSGSSGSSRPSGEDFTITFNGKYYYASTGDKLGDATASDGTKLSDAIDNYEPEEGYTNKGFKDKTTGNAIDLDAEISGNMDIEAIDEPAVLYVTYDANGGTMMGQAVYKDEANSFNVLSSYTLLTVVPLWDGEGNYTFAGWYRDKDVWQVPVSDTIAPGETKDVTLYAKWEPYSNLTFVYNRDKSDEDTVSIDVVLDKLPYGVDKLTHIEVEYSFLKKDTSDEAELIYVGVSSEYGTPAGTEAKITLSGVNITAEGTLFTIEFSKVKDYAEDVTFKFGNVVLKEDADEVVGYNKIDATIDTLTGVQKYEIVFAGDGETYIVFEGETIGSAKQKGNDTYTLAKAFEDYENSLDKDIYIFNRYVNANDTSKEVKATDVVTAGMTLTRIDADLGYVPYDVVYNAGEGTVNDGKTYTDPEATNYNNEYTLLGEDELDLVYEGYKFLGWYMDGDAQETIINTIPKNTKGPVTVHAKWEIVKYDIIYNANGGSFTNGLDTYTVPDAHTVKDNYEIDKTLTLAKEGYIFSGEWYREPEETTAVGSTITYVPSDKTATSIEIFAGWTKVYKIHLGEDDYIVEEDKKYSTNENLANAMKDIIDAAPDGHEAVFTGTFKGENNEEKTTTVSLDTTAAADMTVTYEYVAIPYGVTYNWDGGRFADGVNPADYATYTIVNGLVLPKAEHVYKSDAEYDYDFKGWYDNEELSGDPVTEIPAGQMGPKEFWAKWEAKPKEGLGFFIPPQQDETTGTAEIYMTLTKVPYDINGELSNLELEFEYGDSTAMASFLRAVPSFRFVSAEPMFAPESDEHFSYEIIQDGKSAKVTWSNYTNPITSEELEDNGKKLFKLVFEFNNEEISGKRIFRYVENRTTLKGKDDTTSTKYEISDAEMAFTVRYTQTVYTQNVGDAYNADPKTYEKDTTYPRAEEDTIVTYNNTDKTGFTIDLNKSKLSGTNSTKEPLEIVVYYNRNLYTVEFEGEKYYFLHGHKLFGGDNLTEGARLKAALDADFAENEKDAEEGFEWTFTTNTGVKLDRAKDYEVTQDLVIEGSYGLKEYNITYYDTRTTTFVPSGAKTKITKEDEYTLPTPTKAGYSFLGWYSNPDFEGDAVTKINKGTLKDLEFWAKWEVDSVLSFTHMKDEDAQTVTVTVVLSNIPEGVDNLAAMSIYFTQTPKLLKLESARALFDAESFDFSDGALVWTNSNDAITSEELLANGGKLFELVYSYTLPVNSDVVLEYTSETELASSSFEVADPSKYTMKSETIPFDVEYTVITYKQKVTDTPDADPKSYDDESKPAHGKANEEITYTPETITGFTIDKDASELYGINNGSLVIKVYYNRNKYTVEFNGSPYYFLYEHKLFQGTALGTALTEYAAKRLEEGFIVTYTYGDGSALDPTSGDTITGEVTINVTEIPVTDEEYTVTFYDGKTVNKGSVQVPAGGYVTQAQIDGKLGDPEDYDIQTGYTNSDGVVHEIRPELWYNDGKEWKIFEPAKVQIVKNTEVYLLTSYVAAYYDTDLEYKGIKLPQKEIVIPYDSNTELLESALDILTAAREVIASTLYDIETEAKVDLFAAMLERAAKTKFVDAEGNLLNPEIPIPLHRLITEDLIMKEIDRYIDRNIDDEEFIAEILRNDTVVEMLLEDESIPNKVLSDKSMRDKLLTDSVIKTMISKDVVIDYIITNEKFKKTFIDSDATFEYIVGDLKELLGNTEYHDMIIDACVEFVIDAYFEEKISAPELDKYIDSVLDSEEFIKEIEANAELRPLFEDEIKSLIKDLANKPSTDETKKEIYATIRESDTFKKAIIDAVINDEEIMKPIRDEVKADLASEDSKYKAAVIEAVRAEFNDPASQLKQQIVDAVKEDLKLGSESVLRDTVAQAIKDDFNSESPTLKETVIAQVKSEVSDPESQLRKSILEDAATQGSTIEGYVKSYVQSSEDIKEEIKPLVKNNEEVEAVAKSWIVKEDNLKSVNDKIKSAIKTDKTALSIAITESAYASTPTEAETLASDYLNNKLESSVKQAIDDKIDEFFKNVADVAAMIEENFDIMYASAYDSIFDELYAAPEVFDEAYASYVSDPAKLDDAFGKYISAGENLEKAVNTFVEDPDRLVEAIDIFISNASGDDLGSAIDTYIVSDKNLISAVNTYISDSEGDNIKTVFDIFKNKEANLMEAFDVYIAEDTNLNAAFGKFAANDDAFHSFYEEHLGVNAEDPELFNTMFEAYYETHVHQVAKEAYKNEDLNDLVMDYVYTHTDEMVADYASGDLAKDHPELDKTIDGLMKTEFPRVIREKYYEEGSTIKTTVDHLIETEGTKLIKQYAANEIEDADTVKFIKDTIDENIGIIVDDYVAGNLDKDIRKLVDEEIDSYMNRLINDYISDVGTAREDLGELIPTYAQDAVDALKGTDAFKNTISDFVSGKGVRVNKDNIMFISILSDLMSEYDYDKIMADFAPEQIKKAADKLGVEIAEKYVNALLDDFVGGMKEAEGKLQADLDNEIENTEYTFSTTPRVRVYYMKDFVVAAYDKAMPKITGKLLSKELIAANPYAKRLLDKNWITELLDYDPAKDGVEMSGYSLKKGTYDEDYNITESPIMTYYDIVLENIILLHDAVMWYGDNYSEASIESKLDAVSALIGTYANKANDVIMHYINTGELPKGYTPYEIADKILDKVLGINGKIDDAYDKVEDKYYENEERILELVQKLKDFYSDKLNRDYKEIIDLANLKVYAEDEVYDVYKILLEMNEENKAFNIDKLAIAIDDSTNYHGINKLESAMDKIKSKLSQFEDKKVVSDLRIIRNAYKATLTSREIRGREIGNHTVKLHRYFE